MRGCCCFFPAKNQAISYNSSVLNLTIEVNLHADYDPLLLADNTTNTSGSGSTSAAAAAPKDHSKSRHYQPYDVNQASHLNAGTHHSRQPSSANQQSLLPIDNSGSAYTVPLEAVTTDSSSGLGSKGYHAQVPSSNTGARRPDISSSSYSTATVASQQSGMNTGRSGGGGVGLGVHAAGRDMDSPRDTKYGTGNPVDRKYAALTPTSTSTGFGHPGSQFTLADAWSGPTERPSEKLVTGYVGNGKYLTNWCMYSMDWCKWPPGVHGSYGKVAVASYSEDSHNYVWTDCSTILLEFLLTIFRFKFSTPRLPPHSTVDIQLMHSLRRRR